MRYASWSKPKTMQDKPDLVLFDGEYYGQSSWDEYTFQNYGWTYTIGKYLVGKNDDIGLFLSVSHEDRKEGIYQRCKEVNDVFEGW